MNLPDMPYNVRYAVYIFILSLTETIQNAECKKCQEKAWRELSFCCNFYLRAIFLKKFVGIKGVIDYFYLKLKFFKKVMA